MNLQFDIEGAYFFALLFTGLGVVLHMIWIELRNDRARRKDNERRRIRRRARRNAVPTYTMSFPVPPATEEPPVE